MEEREGFPPEEREALPGDSDVEGHLLGTEEREAFPPEEREAFPPEEREAFPPE